MIWPNQWGKINFVNDQVKKIKGKKLKVKTQNPSLNGGLSFAFVLLSENRDQRKWW